MSLSIPQPGAEPLRGATRLQQNLHDLHNTLSRIMVQNQDSSLQPLIAETVSLCILVRQQFDRMSNTQSGPDPIVDAKVFQRLMALAGPATALDLLRQLMLDLDAVTTAIAAAAPTLNKAAFRAQCHILIAVAGSIGAVSVQTDAEHLHRAMQNNDEPRMTLVLDVLLQRLSALMAYVQDELHTRTPP